MRALSGILILLVIAGVLMVVAARLYMREQRKKVPAAATAMAANIEAAGTAVSLLRSGDVVVRKGVGIFSHFMSLFNQRDKSYSHCGLVLVEHGYPFVYHCTGGENDTRPCIRRDSAVRFLNPAFSMAAGIARYPFTDTVVAALKAEVKRLRRSRPVFDAQFSMATDDKLYCSEFVYKVITAAMADTAYLPLSSIAQGSYVGIDDLFVNAHAKLIWQVRYK